MNLQMEDPDKGTQNPTTNRTPATKIVVRSDEQWHRAYERLRAFVQREGHVRVPMNHVEDGVQLYHWIHRQLVLHRKQKLSEERRRLLDQIPCWAEYCHDAQWERLYAVLQLFVEREGHARVPNRHVENGYRLGAWVGTQRGDYRAGRMCAERIQRLEQVVGWSWTGFARGDNAQRWEHAFSLLVAFAERNGHTRVPDLYRQEECGLGAWVRFHRRTYQSGRLTKEKERRLESVPNWVWKVPDEQKWKAESWEHHYRVLEQFVQREGHARVGSDHVEDGLRLGQWVRNTRELHRRGKLRPERANRLERLPGWSWDTCTDAWESSFNLLEDYVAQYQTAAISAGVVFEGRQIGNWVANQRALYRSGRMSAKRRRRLESLRGWAWDQKEDAWDSWLVLLEEYIAEHKTALVSIDVIVGGRRLGLWVANQRGLFRKGKLLEDRQSRLESLPGWVWTPTENTWDDWFSLLEDYVAEHNTANVPAFDIYSGRHLGKWVTHQRMAFKTGRMPEARSKRLEALSGWVWDPKASTWDDWLALLESYVAEHKTANVPTKALFGGRRLGWWISHQRTDFRTQRLPDDRRQRLEILPGWYWDIAEQRSWNRAYDHLLEFARREGHARVPLTHEESGYLLGPWVEEQRVLHARGELIGRRSQKLESLPLWSWSFS